jgi:hypothetical protein
MRLELTPCLCALTLVALATGPAAADEDAAPPRRLVVHYDQVDPAHAPEFEAWYKEWVAAFKEAGMPREWSWSLSSFPNFEYVSIAFFRDFADLDQTEARQKLMEEKLGEERFAELMKGMKWVESHHDEIVRLRPDLSYFPKAGSSDEHRFVNMQTHWVRPGMEQRFEATIKKVAKAYADTEQPIGFAGYQVEFGAGSYAFGVTAKTAVEFWQHPSGLKVLTKAYGSEQAQEVLAEWRQCVKRYETRNGALRPELSYVASPTPTE